MPISLCFYIEMIIIIKIVRKRILQKLLLQNIEVVRQELLNCYGLEVILSLSIWSHGAAAPVALFVALAVFDGERDLRELGHHAEKRRHPHPEHGAGAA